MRGTETPENGPGTAGAVFTHLSWANLEAYVVWFLCHASAKTGGVLHVNM